MVLIILDGNSWNRCARKGNLCHLICLDYFISSTAQLCKSDFFLRKYLFSLMREQRFLSNHLSTMPLACKYNLMK